MSLDSLKALKEKLRAEKEALTGGKPGEKYHRKAELEAAKLQRIRDEEEEERRKKANLELKRKQEAGLLEDESAKKAKTEHKEQEQLLPDIPEPEVIRRLRALGHPATLFAEDHVSRLRRFLKAEKELAVEDETMGGQQENVMLGLKKQA
uniref:Pre-mRNA processing factor 4 (PRP4)-like domain-containing protein n=1 Tax=Dunaliella tertiolecta TaxID=3047 RepID=A0A7S3QRE8_DUNTE